MRNAGTGEECGSPELVIAADPDLVAEGWVRRNLADPTRVEELTELYASLGYEVKTQHLRPADLDPQCSACAMVAACGSSVVIYTRKPPLQRPTTP